MMFMGSRERDCTTARVFFSYSNSALVRLPRTDTSLVCRSTSASFQKQVGGSAYSEVQQKSGVQFIKIMNEEIRKKGRGRPVDEIAQQDRQEHSHPSVDHVVGQKRSGFPVGLGAESDIPSGLNQHSVAFHLRIVKGHLYLVAHWADGLENDSGN